MDLSKYYPLVQRLNCSCRGRGRVSRSDRDAGDTTWYRERLRADPVASFRAENRRNARKGVGRAVQTAWLKVRAIPQETETSSRVPTKRSSAWFLASKNRVLNAVMPLDVLGRTRATLTEPTSLFLVREVWVILLNSVVLGIEHCNYCSSTRNA